jgi:ATP-binding cassette subfamily B (MDR/TAP) protein 1
MNAIAFLAMIASGTLLPLMDLIFGKFVTIFTGFSVGIVTAEKYREEINYYT